MACAMRKVPYVVNITGLGTAVENGGLVQKITVTLYRLALRKVQRVFFQNEENRQFFADRKLALGKHGMLPGSGVNLQRFTPLEYPGEETTEFVFISRIMKEKGADQYLEAAEYIRGKYPNTRFHICGFCEQAYEQRLKELHDREVIIYHGMVRDVKQVIAKTHCTIHPTYYPEGLSNVLLESAACARALITTNRSGCREVIDDGINGFVVEQKNTQDLIAKIETFLALPWVQKKAMGIAGRAKVEREFDRQIVVEKYLKEMKNL
jgi:galacturonosyltransferase